MGNTLKETFPGWSYARKAASEFMYAKKGDMRKNTRSEAKDMWFTYCWKHKIAMPLEITKTMW